jgi:hypothetical protein
LDRRTGGRLNPAERRRLISDLARVHVSNLVGRVGMLAHLNRGRRSHVPPERLLAPDSPLTRVSQEAATRILPTTLLNHSHRTYLFGRAPGELDRLEVDAGVAEVYLTLTEIRLLCELFRWAGSRRRAGTDGGRPGVVRMPAEGEHGDVIDDAGGTPEPGRELGNGVGQVWDEGKVAGRVGEVVEAVLQIAVAPFEQAVAVQEQGLARFNGYHGPERVHSTRRRHGSIPG